MTTRIHPLGLLIFLWLISIVAVNPIGEFPLNDDWAYAHNVHDFQRDGVLKLSDWIAMTQIAHWFYGHVFTTIFGFSFTALRISTLLLSVIGILVFYGLTGFISRDRVVRTATTFVFAFNPLYYQLSFTFMTDVPFLVFFLATMYASMKYLEDSQNRKWLFAATLLIVVAVLTRQTGAGIGFSLLFLGFLLRWNEKKLPSRESGPVVFSAPAIRLAVILSIFAILTLYLYSTVLGHYGIISRRLGSVSDLTWILGHDKPVQRTTYFLAITLVHLGVFLIPFLPWLQKSTVKLSGSSPANWIFTGLGVLIAAVTFTRFPIPTVGNMLHADGLGPMLTADLLRNTPSPGIASQFVYMMLLIGGCIVASIVLRRVWDVLSGLLSRNRANKAEEPTSGDILAVWSALIVGGFTLFSAIGQSFFDRYILLSVPMVLLFSLYLIKDIVWSEAALKRSRTAVSILGVLLMFWSVAGTRDYLEANRVRWQVLHELMASGVPASHIDGGFEFNAWYRTGELIPWGNPKKSWWFVGESHYLVTFKPIDGIEPEASRTYQRWLVPGKAHIYISRQDDESRE